MALEWTAEHAAGVLRMPTASDDKYSRGVLGVRTGSERYPGAAVLGVEAAHRTGLGMVRYLGPERPTALVLARRPETVTADGRVQAWLIGSGTDASERRAAETRALRDLLAGEVPVVVDAGALDLVADAPGSAPWRAPVVVTPHDVYYNMLEKIEDGHMDVVDLAKEAMEAAGVTPQVAPIRGGTDGAQLSFRGLPCPNLFTGGANFHGRYEYLPIPSLVKACETVIEIAKRAAQHS